MYYYVVYMGDKCWNNPAKLLAMEVLPNMNYCTKIVVSCMEVALIPDSLALSPFAALVFRC